MICYRSYVVRVFHTSYEYVLLHRTLSSGVSSSLPAPHKNSSAKRQKYHSKPFCEWVDIFTRLGTYRNIGFYIPTKDKANSIDDMVGEGTQRQRQGEASSGTGRRILGITNRTNSTEALPDNHTLFNDPNILGFRAEQGGSSEGGSLANNWRSQAADPGVFDGPATNAASSNQGDGGCG